MTCRDPHHDDMARRALNAEIAAFHLKGWSMIVDALLELSRISSYDHQSRDGVGMVMSEAFYRLAETLEPPPASPPEAGPKRPRRRPQPKPPDDNVRWLTRRLTELGRKPGEGQP